MVKNSIVFDGFCGAGGNSIQFSNLCKYVISNDIDESKVGYLKNNSEIYKCKDNIISLNKDFLKITKEEINKLIEEKDAERTDKELPKQDDMKETEGIISNVINKDKNSLNSIFLSPPWGGISYKDSYDYSLQKQVTPDINLILKHSLSLSSNSIILFLPRNTNIIELFELLIKNGYYSDKDSLVINVEFVISSSKIKALLIMIGDKHNTLSVKMIKRYLNVIFKKLDEYLILQLVHVIKEIGFERFLLSMLNLFYTKKDKENEDNINKTTENTNDLDLKENSKKDLGYLGYDEDDFIIMNNISNNSKKDALDLLKYIKQFEMTEDELKNYVREENLKTKERKKENKSNLGKDNNFSNINNASNESNIGNSNSNSCKTDINEKSKMEKGNNIEDDCKNIKNEVLLLENYKTFNEKNVKKLLDNAL